MRAHPQDTAASAVNRVTRGALLVASFAALALTSRVLYLCGAGIDFTDEGYYLNWIAHHDLYPVSSSQFGFVYGPLSRLLGGDVVLLRQANVILTLALAFVLFRVCFHTFPSHGAEASPATRGRTIALSAVCATSSLVFLYQWIPTPSYNSLALQALLLTATGLLLARRETSRPSVVGWVVIGLGGGLAFAAKPTTAALLTVITGVWLLASGRINLRLIALAVATSVAFVGILAWGADGSLTTFVGRLVESAADAGRLQGGYALPAMFRWPDFELSLVETFVFWSNVALLAVAGVLSSAVHPAARVAGAACAILFAIVAGAVGLGWLDLPFAPPRFLGVQFLAIPLTALLTGTILHRAELRAWLRGRPWTAVACLCMFPYAYAFGTNNFYAVNGAWAAVFWVLAGIILLAANSPRATWASCLTLATGAQLMATVLLQLASEHPYRQTKPLRAATTYIEIRPDSPLRVSADFAKYLGTLQSLARNAGFQPGDPMIDLTGHYPTSLYFLEARPLGLPWIPGEYPGSDDLALAALARVTASDLRRAWLLTEPEGRRAISPTVLQKLGLDVAKDYVEVGTLDSPMGTYPESYRQRLLKPAR